MGHQVKEKIVHFLHMDRKSADNATTPGASPGYADVQTILETTTTTETPGLVQETDHSDASGDSYQRTMKFESGDEATTATVALKTDVPGTPTNGEAPRPAPAVPLESEAMMGVPPSSDHLNEALLEEAPPAPVSSPEGGGID